MRKIQEQTDPNSCLSKAKPHELVFVLLGRDAAAPETIRFWVAERIRIGKNQPADAQVQEALDLAKLMEQERGV
jgi:hypothetical protein